MEEWVKTNQPKVKGKAVLVGKAAVIPVNFDLPAKRRDDEQVKAQYDPNNPNAGRGRGGFGGGGRGGPTDPNRLTAAQVTEQIDAMLVAGGAAVRLNDAARGDGMIVAQQNRAYDPAKSAPTVILRNDDFGRVERLLADGEDVKMEFHIVNHVYPEGKTSYMPTKWRATHFRDEFRWRRRWSSIADICWPGCLPLRTTPSCAS
jgi:hypothetical protein